MTAQLPAATPRRAIDQLNGLLAGKTNGARLSIEEIEDSIATAGAAAGTANSGNCGDGSNGPCDQLDNSHKTRPLKPSP